MVRGNADAIARHFNRHRGMRLEKLGQNALMVRGEVLHQHKGHAGIDRHIVEKVLNAARPPADAPMPTTNEGGRRLASPTT